VSDLVRSRSAHVPVDAAEGKREGVDIGVARLRRLGGKTREQV